MTVSYLDILAETIRNNWDQPALTDFYLTEDGKAQDTSRGNHYTYGEMYEEIVRVADLLTNLGLQKGDHIAICGANSAHWVIAYLAIAKMQGVSVTVMHSLQPAEITHLIDFSDAKALFVNEDLWGELKEQQLPQIKNVLALEDWSVLQGENVQISHLQSSIFNRDVQFEQLTPDALAMICYTSGSTGGAKGVMLSYRNINVTATFDNNIFKQFKGEKSLQILPLAHIYGITTEILQPISLGIHIHMLMSPYNVGQFLLSCQLIGPSFLIIVPYLLEYIVKVCLSKGIPIPMLRKEILSLLGSGVKIIGIGGAKISKDTQEIVDKIALPLLPGYGATECGPRISSYRTTDEDKIGSSGRPLDQVKVSICPETCEILVKGENVMLGYYKDPEATAQKIDKDGWLHTGDKGHLDEDGYLYVEGRLEQDVIVLPNGENIRPDNIEALINAIPEVKESIVLARDGRLVALVVPEEAISNQQSAISLRRNVLRTVNPQLPLFSQLYDVEITDQPLQRTEKQTIKRYLYK